MPETLDPAHGGRTWEDHDTLLATIRACTVCAERLPLGPRPILQSHARARILVAGQAPGRKAHASGIPFDDASGDRLREWMGLTRAEFYDDTRVAIVPMGFCYPGTGKSGDLPPMAECARHWRAAVLAQMRDIALTLVIGQYAQDWHLGRAPGEEHPHTVTARVQAWRSYWPQQLPLPHPSPRNNLWMSRHAWFNDEVLPELRRRVREIMSAHPSSTTRAG